MQHHLHVDFALQNDLKEGNIVLPGGPPLLQTWLLRGVQVPEGDLLQARGIQPSAGRLCLGPRPPGRPPSLRELTIPSVRPQRWHLLGLNSKASQTSQSHLLKGDLGPLCFSAALAQK